MIPELGHFALILSLFVALAAGILPLVGAHRNQAQWIAFARPATSALFVLILISYACLTWAFYVDDFSVGYVAGHSNSQMPTIFRLSAVWGGHEGSLLLWALMLAGWAMAVALFSRQLPDAMVARVLGVMGLVMVGLLAFTLFTSSPFERLIPAPAEGRSLNPLLQDFGLLYHPPLLYMGYVGLSVAFAFAIAALLAGQLDAAWARWSRPWTIAAWAFLTLGNSLGSWWAYYELGWGGWWFWDPVENASFMPWLLATALIHSLAVTEKRGSFKNWTVLLAIAAFSLTLLGTFLVRSGVLTSVHAFATDPGRGMFILIFLTFVIGSSLLLFAIRAPKVGLGGRFALVSRETLLLANNVLLVVACGAVFLGTIYPLLIDALGMGKISVGPPYFNAVFIPLMLPVLARRIGNAATHAVGLLCGAAGFVGLLLIRDPDLLLLPMVGMGIAWASVLSMPYVILTRALPPRKFGIYIGIFNFFIVIPQLVVATLMGGVMRSFFPGEPRWTMLVASLMMAAAAATMFLVKENARVSGE